MSKDREWSVKVITRVLRTSICVPSVRMVEVVVYDDGDGIGVSFHPVIAIKSVVEASYSKSVHRSDDCDDSGTKQQLIECGWEYDGTSERMVFVVCEDGELIDFSSNIGGCEQTVVPAPWPPEEDSVRLKDVVEELHKELCRNEPALASLNHQRSSNGQETPG